MIVFVAICWKYVYPPILQVMQEREKKISDGLEAAKKADDSLEEAWNKAVNFINLANFENFLKFSEEERLFYTICKRPIFEQSFKQRYS